MSAATETIDATSAGVAFARQSLIAYTIAQWGGYRPLPLHFAIAEKLEAVERGEIKRLIITVPPQHGKSTLASEHFPTWCVGRNPRRNVACITYSQDKADDWGGRVKHQIESPVYSATFPDFTLKGDSGSKRRWETTQRGGYAAVGIGGPLTGRPVDIALIDDPYKDDTQADSAAWRRQVQNWYQSVLSTRIDQNGAIVLILTRWREDDLAGWLLENHKHDGWEILNIPAICEEPQGDPLGRAKGDVLWPERFPLQYLENRRITLGSRKFEALYQQRPTVAQGSIFKREWWKFYNPLALPQLHTVFGSWDTAEKTSEDNDESAGTEWGVGDRGLYLLARWHGKERYGDLKRRVTACGNRLGATPGATSYLIIEDKSSGTQLIQDLQDETTLTVLAENPGPAGSKVVRAEAATPTIESGRVLLPDPATPGYEWVEDLIDELAAFPHGRYRDTADSVSQAIRHYAARYTHQGAYAYTPVRPGDARDAGADDDLSDTGGDSRGTW